MWWLYLVYNRQKYNTRHWQSNTVKIILGSKGKRLYQLPEMSHLVQQSDGWAPNFLETKGKKRSNEVTKLSVSVETTRKFTHKENQPAHRWQSQSLNLSAPRAGVPSSTPGCLVLPSGRCVCTGHGASNLGSKTASQNSEVGYVNFRFYQWQGCMMKSVKDSRKWRLKYIKFT